MTKKTSVDLLMCGNGSIGIDSAGNAYINKQAGSFLHNLAKRFNLLFIDLSSRYEKDTNLLDFKLNNSSIPYTSVFFSGTRVSQLLKLLRQICNAKIIYAFYPGKLSTLVSLLCILFFKEYGLYVRGEHVGKNWLSRLILKRAEFIITVSPLLKQRLSSLCNDITVIRPMNLMSKSDIFERSISFNAPSTSQQPTKLLYVGSVGEHKGIYTLIDTLNHLNRLGENIILTVVGGGSLLKALLAQQMAGRIPGNIRFIGQKNYEQTLTCYEAADAFIFLSKGEGFPRVLYEAMIKSLPIFTTFVGGIPGRMIDGGNCIRVPVDDPQKTAKIISENIHDTEKLNRITVAAMNAIREIIETEPRHEDVIIDKVDGYAGKILE